MQEQKVKMDQKLSNKTPSRFKTQKSKLTVDETEKQHCMLFNVQNIHIHFCYT